MFHIWLASADNADIGNSIGIGRIRNDDTPPILTVQDASAAEGSGVVFMVSLLQRSEQEIVMQYQPETHAGANAASANDFTSTQRELTFKEGDTRKSFTVSTQEDSVHERDETFTVTLSTTQSPPRALQGDWIAEGTIENNDQPPVVELVLSPSPINENGDSTTVSATLSHPSVEETTVTVTAAAVSPAVAADFEQSGETLTIAALGTTHTGLVQITAMNNGVDAPDKRVTVSGMAENDLGVQAETPRSVTLTIEDDEDPPTVTLALVPGTIGENGGTTVLTPSLSHPSSEATVVTLLPSADDYTTSAAELTIAAGMTTVGGATLTAVNNETDAPDNEVMVMATAVNSQGIAGGPGGADVDHHGRRSGADVGADAVGESYRREGRPDRGEGDPEPPVEPTDHPGGSVRPGVAGGGRRLVAKRQHDAGDCRRVHGEHRLGDAGTG